MSPSDVGSLVDLLRFRAQIQKDARGYTFLVDGEAEGARLNYEELDRESRAIAATLQRHCAPGERALLAYPPGLQFVSAFLGCLCAGVVAVPVALPHPARPARSVPRLRAIARDCGSALVLSTEALVALAPALGTEVPELRAACWLATDRIDPETANAWQAPRLEPDGLAFLQYTSGSTAMPKGVMVSHANLLANLAAIDAAAQNDDASVSVSWLPVYHDMGLIEGVLAPLFGGYPVYLMAPAAFLQKPLRWLAAISRYRATQTGGPNFAYDLCVRKTTPAERQGLDLRSWRVAYNGAEPVRAATLAAFRRAFAPCGFRWRAFYPVYGLAEATLGVSSGGQADAPVLVRLDAAALGRDRVRLARGRRADAVTLVACGPPLPGTRVAIADPETGARCAPDEVGEIWVAGPSVARGYWNRPDETARTFHARPTGTRDGPFLRTGDLGFLHAGQLVVTGRAKDLLIVRGRKHYPQDLELTAERSHGAVRPGCVTAFSVPGPDGERVAIVAEVEPRRLPLAAGRGGARGGEAPTDLEAVTAAIREAIAVEHELQVTGVSLLAPGELPKTSSGKLQRRACRAAFLAGTLTALTHWVQGSGRGRAVVPGASA